MRRNRFVICILCLCTSFHSVTALEIRDRLRTREGEVISGRIVERYPGVAYHIETAGEIRIIPVEHIEWIEKILPASGDDRFLYTDIVYLDAGLMLHGSIVAEEPGKDITLLSHNGAAVSIPLDRIRRITHEKRSSLVPPGDIEENTQVQRLRLEFAVELTLQQMESEKKKTGEDSDEVDRLREELTSLEKESAAAAAEQEKDDAYIARLLGEISETDSEAEEALTELARRAAACAADNPEDMSRIADLYMTGLSGINDVARLADTLNDIDPGIVREVRKAEEAATIAEIEVMMNGSFRDPEYVQRIMEIAGRVPEEDREEIFKETRAGIPVAEAVLNGLSLIGVGSMKQGDRLGAAIQAGTLLIGALFILDSLAVSELNNNENLQLTWSGWVGAGIVGTGYAFSLVRPFLYASRRNSLARQALLLEDNNEKM